MSTTRPQAVVKRTSGLFGAPVAVAALCAVIYLLTASYSSVSTDVVSSNILSWQIATSGDVQFDESIYPPISEHPYRSVWVLTTDDGREVIGRSPGAVGMAIPAYLVAGGGAFSLAPGAISAALLSAISVLLIGLTLRDFLPPRESALAMCVVGFGTPVWSVAADGMWPHTITVLGLCGMAWSAHRERWWAAGLLGGLVLWGRLHAAVIVAVVGLFVAWRRRDPLIAIRVGLASGLALALQCVWTRVIYSSWNPMSSYDTGPFEQYADTNRFDLANQLGAWISPDRGILVWTPLLALLLPALARSWRSLPDWSRALVVAGVLYTLLQGVLNRFSGGDGFYGYRLMLEPLACLVPAVALSAPQAGPIARRCFAPLLTCQVFVIATGAILNGLGTRAEDVWTRHSFFTPLASSAPAMFGFVLACLAVGALGRRLWSDPRVGTN